MTIDAQRFLQLLLNSLGKAGRVFDAADLLHQDGELVAAEAANRIPRADATLKSPRNRDKQLVADQMP